MTVRQRLKLMYLIGSAVIVLLAVAWGAEAWISSRGEQARRARVEYRSELITEIRGSLGYGGMIHALKNYVLRGDRTDNSLAAITTYEKRFWQAEQEGLGSIARYRSLHDLREDEEQALDQLSTVLLEYGEAMELAEQAYDEEGGTITAEELDARIAVDDRPGVAALEQLMSARDTVRGEIEASLDQKTGIIHLVRFAVLSGGLGFFLLMGSKLTRPVTQPMIDIGGGMEIDAKVAASFAVKHDEVRKILDALPALIYFKDENNIILNLNHAAAQKIGLPVEEIIGKPTELFFPAEDAAAFLEADRKVIRSGRPLLGIEEKHVTESGGELIIRTDKIPISGPGGRIDRLVAVASDITALREAQTEAEENRRLLEQSMKHARQGGWRVDPRDRAVEFSDTWYAMLGFEPRELPMTSTTWESLVHPDDLAGVWRIFEEHIRGTTPRFDATFRMRHKCGDWIWIRSIGEIAARDERGRPTRVSGMHLDIDRERKLSETLRRKTEEMEAFLYSASHDLKSPIVTILGFLSHIGRCQETGDTVAIDRYIGIIRDAAERMRMNVEDILEVSRLGRMEVKPCWIDLRDACRTVELMHTQGLEDSGAQLTYEFADDRIWCDERHVVSVLSNLVGNALKYADTGQGLAIAVRTRHDRDGLIRLEVHDNGPGIAGQHAERVFRLFERLDTDQGGTGIGLTIVSRIADLWGGRAWLEPTEQGACFVVTLNPSAHGTAPIDVKEARDAPYRHGSHESSLLAG